MRADEFVVELYKAMETARDEAVQRVLALEQDKRTFSAFLDIVSKNAKITDRGIHIFIPNFGRAIEEYDFAKCFFPNIKGIDENDNESNDENE